ncbi:isoleucyl-tRNA synthetase [Algibacter lectus]|uniref:Isoleucyl-tRNA synthetase n=1 Tax=Algibacter lectus TaxID=221126 RepID=A0A090WY70_9FLAO|nr:isoleucyl-tRNA synthetase [Algibacter lectus]
MSAKFPEYKGLDLPNVADQILNYWQENNIFEKSVTTREGKKPFVFFEGPPSANGLPGVHHVLARAIKDIFPRYKTMKGYQVKRKAGWDTHGLPIELGVEKELGITKEDIGKTISVEDYNAACRKAVMRYTDVWNNLTQKMGVLGRYGRSIRNLRTKIHGNSLVAIKRNIYQKFNVQRLHYSALFA